MIFPALSDLFFGFVPLGISDDLHADAIIETANDFLKLLSKIAPYTPLPTAEELAEDFLNRV